MATGGGSGEPMGRTAHDGFDDGGPLSCFVHVRRMVHRITELAQIMREGDHADRRTNDGPGSAQGQGRG